MVMIHAASQRIPVGPSASPFLPLTRRSAYHDPFCLSLPLLSNVRPLLSALTTLLLFFCVFLFFFCVFLFLFLLLFFFFFCFWAVAP